MNTMIKSLAVLASVILSSLASATVARNGDAHEKMARVPVGTTYIYKKSNIDGSNVGYIATYYRDETNIESFKWHQGNDRGTVVTAGFDPESHLVNHFVSARLMNDGALNVRGVLNRDKNGVFNIDLGDSVTDVFLPLVSWHSYDFDFADLSYAYRFLENKKQTYNFHIYDLIRKDEGPDLFEDVGAISMVYLSTETVHGKQMLKYAIDGPGLDNRGGMIWFNAAAGNLEQFEIQKPDEPGYNSGKFVLEMLKTMTKEEWEMFKITSITN